MTQEEKLHLLVNALASRVQWLRGSLQDPRRDINDECGFPKGLISRELYQDLYDRNPIATRTVQLLPKESWQVQPSIYESEEVESLTPFEKAWADIGQSLRSDKSYFKQEEGSPIWEYLRRADELSGIGQYGILLIGIDDGKDMSQPVAGFEDTYYDSPDTLNEIPTSPRSKVSTSRKLLFLRPFPESLVEITQFESRISSPRFGMPVMYSVTFNDPREQNAGIGLTTVTQNVHWSRCIHIADNLGSSEIFGVPRMRAPLNNLLSLNKIYGADGEAFFRNAILKLFFTSHPQLGPDITVDRETFKDDIEKMMNGLQQWMGLAGFDVKAIAPQVVDPGPHIDAHIEAICILIGCPVRVFKGSERGELASSQDDDAWNDRLRARQKDYITPRIICPFIDRLIAFNVLPTPREYCAYWPDLTSQSEDMKATVALKKTQAMAQYVSGQVETIIPPVDYLTRILGMTEREAQEVSDNAEELVEEKEQEQMAKEEDRLKKMQDSQQGQNGQQLPGNQPQGQGQGYQEDTSYA